MTRSVEWLAVACVLVITSCSSDSDATIDRECDAEPILQSTSDGVEFVRTPSRCFEDLAGFDYELKSVENPDEIDPELQPIFGAIPPRQAWAGLQEYAKPFLTVWASNDPGNLGSCETQHHTIAATRQRAE